MFQIQKFKLCPNPVWAADGETAIKEFVSQFLPYNVIVTNKRESVIDMPVSFDIEASSFLDENGEKRATMYVWQMCVNGRVIMGRTWEEFLSVIDAFIKILDINSTNKMYVYVHFLSYEFQWIMKLFDWKEVFAIDSRSVLYAETIDGIVFRCSYMLSGYALKDIPLTKYAIRKLDGKDYDYHKIRHSETPLTDLEIQYCIHDVLVVAAYIKELCEREGNITRLAYTKTGFTRRAYRNACLPNSDPAQWKEYRNLMDSLTMDALEFKQLRRAFQGGFTHANGRFSRRTVENVDSVDFTSSYPYVMATCKFPMSKAKMIKVTAEKPIEYWIEKYCCLFDLELFNVEPIFHEENYLSVSKCRNLEGVIENNGRIVSAKHLITTVTDVDFRILRKFYTWEKRRIADFRIYRRGRLPTVFVKQLLKLYATKTELKDVEERKIEYNVAKENTNASYGMGVTNPVRDQQTFDYISNSWDDPVKITELEDIQKELDKYNKDKKRFLFYPWGVWITAYARYNLCMGILEFEDDYIYCDTDSIKSRNFLNHWNYIQKYNNHVINELTKAAEYHKIPLEQFMPQTIKGIKKPLGVWDWETGKTDDSGNIVKHTPYPRFKTLGAKRYMHDNEKGEIEITVAGLSKTEGAQYLLKQFGFADVFNKFDTDLKVPAEYSGRTEHYYIDDETEGMVTDYLGNVFHYHEYSSIYVSNSEYTLSLSEIYIRYLMGYWEFGRGGDYEE